MQIKSQEKGSVVNDEDDEGDSFIDADDLDPEGREMTLDDFYTPKEGTPKSLINQLYDVDVYGPSVSTYISLRKKTIWSASSVSLLES
jgi:hypothetical protein